MEQLGRKGKGAVRAERKGGAGRRTGQIREWRDGEKKK